MFTYRLTRVCGPARLECNDLITYLIYKYIFLFLFQVSYLVKYCNLAQQIGNQDKNTILVCKHLKKKTREPEF